MFVTADQVTKDDAYAFMPIAQWPPDFQRDQQTVKELHERGLTLFPGYDQLSIYEDKWVQTQLYKEWMPETFLIENDQQAREALPKLTFPFVSKAKVGSASANVRLIRNLAQAADEINAVFRPCAGGLSMKRGRGNVERQTGYLIWQEFVPNNVRDYRVIRLGTQHLVLRRRNRTDVPFASGSGFVEPVAELNETDAQALQAGIKFFDAIKTKWCGIDLVVTQDGQWKVLETTVRWALDAYFPCIFYPRQDRTGAEIWKVVMDELETGAFDDR